MNKAVIFDMDGVIVDSEIYWKKVEYDFLRKLIPSWDENKQRSIIGMSGYDVHALLVKDFGVSLTRDEFMGYYKDLAEDIYGQKVSLIGKVLELLRHFHKENITLGLASSSPKAWIEIVLGRFELNPFFKAVVSSDDIQGPSKPHPEIYLTAAKKLNIAPALCAAIEDTKKGVQSAKGAGMICVGFRNGFNAHQDLSQADHEITCFSELFKVLF